MNSRTFVKGAMTLLAAAYLNPIHFVEASKKLSWWQKKSVYEIYPKSFLDTTGKGTGDLRGVIQQLDYVKNLGVGSIWLTPIYPSPQLDNGYDISNYTAIDPRYGTLDDFDELITEANLRGIKIVMDLVFNHTSDKHPWFVESKSSRDNTKADWYIWRDGEKNNPPTNWRNQFSGDAWTWCEERQQFYLHTFAEYQPDLNWENPEVRRALYDAANFWIARGVGGFRVDAIVYIKKPKIFSDGTPDIDGLCSIHDMIAATPGILDFLHEFKREVLDGKDVFTVAEANGVKPDDLKFWIGEQGIFDMLFEFNHVNVMFENGLEIWHRAKDFKLSDWKKTLTDSQNATKNSWYPIYFENHDKPRSIDNFFPKGADKILAAKALATILFTLRGAPFIYQGEELGIENTKFETIEDYDDISSRGQYSLARADGLNNDQALEAVRKFSRDNARTPMQWNTEKNAGFTRGKPWLPVHENFKTCNVEVEKSDPNSVLNFYRQISALRNSNEILLRGDYKELYHDSEEIYAFSRTLGDKKIIVAVNFTTHDVTIPEKFFLNGKKILGNYPDEKNIYVLLKLLFMKFNL